MAVAIAGFIVTIAAAYLLGSIPTGFLVAKARGIDIRKVGSGNIGATNVFRALGVPAGVFVLLMDALKGWIAVSIVTSVVARKFLPATDPLTLEWLKLSAGMGAILGHNYTCWLRFKGGKGIATSAGVLAALVPFSFLIILSIFILVFAFTRYVSLGSICAALALPFSVWLTGEGSLKMLIVTAAIAVLAILRHKANIKRLLNGTESRVAPRKKAVSGST